MVIFSDGEPNAITAVTNVLKRLGRDENPEDNSNVFIIPHGKDFEEYIVTDDYLDVLVDVIVAEKATNVHHRDALKKEWLSKPNKLDAVKEELVGSKTRYARPVAEAIIGMEDESLRFPPLIRQLFEEISKITGLSTKGFSKP